MTESACIAVNTVMCTENAVGQLLIILGTLLLPAWLTFAVGYMLGTHHPHQW